MAMGVRVDAGGPGQVRFARSAAPVNSTDLLDEMSWLVRLLGRLAGSTPWYTRWESEVISWPKRRRY